jgi:SNF2 family DNA or RNA helicase
MHGKINYDSKQSGPRVLTKAEVCSHLQPDLLSWYVFHGKKRKTEDLGQYDIVITTFQTVSATWRGIEPYQSGSDSSIFSLLWFRVILDEGEST